MSKHWPVLGGIIIGLLILCEGGKLIALGVLLLPSYYAINNLVHLSRKDGRLTMRWRNFSIAFVLEAAAIGVPAYLIIMSEMNKPHPAAAVFLLICLYIIMTALGYGDALE